MCITADRIMYCITFLCTVCISIVVRFLEPCNTIEVVSRNQQMSYKSKNTFSIPEIVDFTVATAIENWCRCKNMQEPASLRHKEISSQLNIIEIPVTSNVCMVVMLPCHTNRTPPAVHFLKQIKKSCGCSAT